MERLKTFAASGEEPWTVLAYRMAALLQSFAPDDPFRKPERDRAQLLAALASTHTGSAEWLALARGVVIDERSPPPIRVLQKIVELNGLVDELAVDETRALALVRDLPEAVHRLPEYERSSLVGKAWGTIGRYLLHRRRPAEALRWLEEAVSFHASHEPVEEGRSRVYLAQALRMLGRHADALDQLDRAERDFRERTAPRNQAYANACRAPWWCYERARLLVEMRRPEGALDRLDEALASVRFARF